MYQSMNQETATQSPVSNIFELNNTGLKAAAAYYFPNGVGIDQDGFLQSARQFYKSLNLNHRGDIWENHDKEILRISIETATQHINGKATIEYPKTNRLMVVGCGDGRLADEYILNAIENGFTEIVFNDLYDFQVDQTREKIERNQENFEKIKISYFAGDFANYDQKKKCDIAIAMFFVSPEILDLQDPTRLRAQRAAYFLAVRNCLHPYGVFIEDTPETSLRGFYRTLKQASAEALHNVKGLGDELNHFTLTTIDVGQTGFPYHVRYMPNIKKHLAERMAVGLKPLYDWTLCVNKDDYEHIQRWKRISLWTP